MNINIEEVKQEILHLLSLKKFTKFDLNRCSWLLFSIKDYDIVFFNTYMAKLQIKKECYENARYYIENAIKLEPEREDLYYDLYRSNVAFKDYNEAFMALEEYKSRVGDKCNVTLHSELLRMAIDLEYNHKYFKSERYIAKSTEYFNNTLITRPALQEKIDNLIHNFNKRDFELVEEGLIELKRAGAIFGKKAVIEVDSLIMIVKRIKKLMEEKYVFNDESKIRKLFTVPLGKLKNYLRDEIPNDYLENRIILKYIDKMIDTDLDRAKILFSCMDSRLYEDANHYLKGRIEEKNELNSYNEDKINEYKYYLELGKEYLDLEKYDLAIDFFEVGKDITGNNIFDYYIGKALYKSDRKYDSLEYLESYIEKGGSKELQALLYLTNGKTYYDKKSESDELWYRFNFINNFFDAGFKDIQRATEKIDFYKDSCSHLSMDHYYEYEFNDKVQLIRSLYLKGQKVLANTLLKELEPRNEEEKVLVYKLRKLSKSN